MTCKAYNVALPKICHGEEQSEPIAEKEHEPGQCDCGDVEIEEGFEEGFLPQWYKYRTERNKEEENSKNKNKANPYRGLGMKRPRVASNGCEFYDG